MLATVKRYEHLRLSRRKGNAVRANCLAKGLVRLIDIPTRTGKTVLLELTSEGRNTLRALGHEIPERSRCGTEHEYWKYQVADKLALAGWAVTVEEPVNGHADITAEMVGKKVAVEIETGKSNWRANLKKNISKGFDEIIIIATNPKAYSQIAAQIKEPGQGQPVRLEQAQEFLESSFAHKPMLSTP